MFKECSLGQALQDNSLNLPAEENLPSTDVKVPHVIVADEAFALHKNLMKPFPRFAIVYDNGDFLPPFSPL